MDKLILGKDKAPALSLHGRTHSDKIENTPAPGDYDPQKAEKIIQDSSPKYSFGIKTQTEKINTTPGKRKCTELRDTRTVIIIPLLGHEKIIVSS